MYGFSFYGTRSGKGGKSKMISDILLNPNAPLGGIYVPGDIPELGLDFLSNSLDSTYKDLAYKVIHSFGLDIGNNLFFPSLHTYDSFDDPNNPAPVTKINNRSSVYVVELFHGPTRAFKDMALQPFGTLVSNLAVAKNQKYLVLAATSGDTGPAALEAFKNKPNVKVVCLYPEGGTSYIQKQQMVKAEGENVKVIGIKGNFDDAQKALKNLLKSESFSNELNEKGYMLSAANSVNFGRIMFQIVYHFWSYLELVRSGDIDIGDEITLVIPSGNFGNGLAAYYAKMMGVPIKKIVLASNSNNVLTDFVKKGEYDLRNRKLIKTTSPAMDILKSSNIERLLYHLFDYERTNELMTSLEKDKYFKLTIEETVFLQKTFDAGFASDEEVSQHIKYSFFDDCYVMDPHTATGFIAKRKLEISGPVIVASTAEWTKFSKTMAESIDVEDDMYYLANKFLQKLPVHIEKLETMPVLHTDIIKIEQIREEVLKFV